jgi:DNA-binding transcriptional ArsR family regulator
MADIFDVIADPTRRDLLAALLDRSASGGRDGEISVGELVEKLSLTQPTVSKHLKVLRDHGLVSVREEGQHRYYRLDPSPLEQLEDWLLPFVDDGLPVDAAGSTVFAAWSGAQLPEPLRRAAEALPTPSDAGTAVGRAAAAASFQAKNVFQDASQEVERRVIEPLRKKLVRKDAD